MQMNRKLLKTFEHLEVERNQLLNEVSTFNEQILKQSPAPDKWSILEILTHLLTSEQLSLGYMKKKAQAIETLGDSGLLEEFKMIVLKLSQRLPIRYKAPRVVRERTPDTLPLSALIEQWNLLRSDLRRFLESIEEKNIRKKIYKHPVAGRLDVHQALLFLNEHIHHHLPQIRRQLKR